MIIIGSWFAMMWWLVNIFRSAGLSQFYAFIFYLAFWVVAHQVLGAGGKRAESTAPAATAAGAGNE
jgi:hypothetical protein